MSVELQLPQLQPLNEQPTAVILIEEHQLVRNALTYSLMHHPTIQLIEAMPYFPSRPEKLVAFDPNVILIGFPQNSISQLSTLLNHVEVWSSNGIATAVLTPYLDPEIGDRLFDAGVYAHVHKTIDMQKLGNVISMAHHFADSFLK